MEWQLVKDWDHQQQDGWDFDCNDPIKDQATLEENIRLREKVKSLDAEVKRLGDQLHQARLAKGLEKPKPSIEQKVINTIAAMRETGAPESDISTFASEYGITA